MLRIFSLLRSTSSSGLHPSSHPIYLFTKKRITCKDYWTYEFNNLIIFYSSNFPTSYTFLFHPVNNSAYMVIIMLVTEKCFASFFFYNISYSILLKYKLIHFSFCLPLSFFLFIMTMQCTFQCFHMLLHSYRRKQHLYPSIHQIHSSENISCWNVFFSVQR